MSTTGRLGFRMLRLATSTGILLFSLGLRAASLEVVDGDRVRIDGELARLVGIDAPELCQPGGPEARETLSALLKGALTYELAGHDANGIQQIRLYANGRELNQSLVQLGWAWDATESAPSRYSFAEAVAKSDRIGLWARETPIPPWTWKLQSSATEPADCTQLSSRKPSPPSEGSAQLRRRSASFTAG